MKMFNVVWTERMSVNVRAEDKEKACEIVLNCEHDEAGVAAEIAVTPSAFEVPDPDENL